MGKRIEGGATAPSGKKIIGVHMTQEMCDFVADEAQKRGLTLSGFICTLIYSEMVNCKLLKNEDLA